MRWDSGEENVYRWGAEGAYDLEVVGAGRTTSSGKYKTRRDFSSDKKYGKYVKKKIRKGMRVRAQETYESIYAGWYGTYYGHTPGDPPAFVAWDDMRGSASTWYDEAPEHERGKQYWVPWHTMEILGR